MATRQWCGVVLLIGSLAGASAWTARQERPPAIGFRPKLTIQLEVASLDRSIEFYTKTLGFKLTERRDDLKFAHIETIVPGVDLGIGEVEKPQPRGFVLNFSVGDADAGRRALERAGVVFQGETLIIPGKVRLAGFLDPDGNRLRLAGPAK
jgi:catechol 2,3-dioxygenase-like lactoylglutathione lyase family enzyme